MISQKKLEQWLREAMIGRDKIRVSVLRLVLSVAHNQAIEKKRELTEEELVLVVKKEIKNRKEAIDIYRKAERKDLLEKEETELAILSEFIPQTMPEEEIALIVSRVIKDGKLLDQAHFGKIMGQVMAKIGKERADGSLVAKVIKEQLSKN